MISPTPAVTTERPAAVAGSFYPADALTARQEIQRCLGRLDSSPISATANEALKALIVPHAGWVYSGTTAAEAYAQLVPLAARIRRVVLLGPCHRVAVRGLAVPDIRRITQFATPLGSIPLDTPAIAALADLPQVQVSDAAHAQEHSLEVQLPFLQTVLGSFELIPLAVGQATRDEVAAVLTRLWGGAETLIVISSDLSHFHPYAEAQTIDNRTVAAIEQLQDLTSHDQACGALPINGLLAVARQRGMRIEKLAQCNSGDRVGSTSADKSRVVGYASFALFERLSPTPELGLTLLTLARGAIAAGLGLATAPTLPTQPAQPAQPALPVLSQPGATFVTLMLEGRLRGCIGSLEAHRSLGQDVAANALAAATRDPRFPALTVTEFQRVRVEVSLLSKPVAMQFTSEEDALRQFRPLIDGIILVAGARRSTFLPQVWEQLPERRQFLAQLKQKAGLPADWWSPEAKLFRYEVQKWKETPA